MLTQVGLSPRVRGNPRASIFGTQPSGSIPARAGEPSRAGATSGSCGVYPRACGGTQSSRSDGSTSKGLSPRVRGNPVDVVRRDGGLGSIPARAGEPRPDDGSNFATWVYPRACGGTVAASIVLPPVLGLSPRVRGNPQPTPAATVVLGSIPARAGEPSAPPACRGGRWVYPRACGGTPDSY